MVEFTKIIFLTIIVFNKLNIDRSIYNSLVLLTQFLLALILAVILLPLNHSYFIYHSFISFTRFMVGIFLVKWKLSEKIGGKYAFFSNFHLFIYLFVKVFTEVDLLLFILILICMIFCTVFVFLTLFRHISLLISLNYRHLIVA